MRMPLQLEIDKKDIWFWYFDLRIYYETGVWMKFGWCLFVKLNG